MSSIFIPQVYRVNNPLIFSPAAGLSIQQPPVLGDLHLQPGLDVQQHLVLLGLSLQVSLQLQQLLLQHAHLALVTR